MIKLIGEKKFHDMFVFEEVGVFHKTDNWNSLNLADVTDFFLSEAQEKGPSVYVYINGLSNRNDPRSFFTNFLLPSIIVDMAIEKSIPFIFCSISEEKDNLKTRLSLNAFLNPKNSAETSTALLNQYVRHQCPEFFQNYFSHMICSASRSGFLLDTENSEKLFLRLLLKTNDLDTLNLKRKTLTSLLLDNNSNFLLSEYGAIILFEEMSTVDGR